MEKLPTNASRKRKGGTDEGDGQPSKRSKPATTTAKAKAPRAKKIPAPKKKAPAKVKRKIKEEDDDDSFFECEKQGSTKRARPNAEEDSFFEYEDVDMDELDYTSKVDGASVAMEWSDIEVLAELHSLKTEIANNIKHLLDQENTIPFIARYRKEQTGNMSPEKLREIKESYECLASVKAKASGIIKSLDKAKKLTPNVRAAVLNSRSVEELEHIYAPYKPSSKRSLAERARQLGLEDAAVSLLNGDSLVILNSLIQPNTKGRETYGEVEKGIQHIIADIISKDKDVLDFVRKLITDANNVRIETSKSKTACKIEEDEIRLNIFEKTNEHNKFQNYFNFSTTTKFVKSHQVLAINRGEQQKIISVKITIPDWFPQQTKTFCLHHWIKKGQSYQYRREIIQRSIEDSYDRLIEPFVIRQVRSELNRKAEKASVEVFSANLKRLLLTPPLKGKIVMAIDPGFKNGCKVSVTSATGGVLHVETMYLHTRKFQSRGDENAYKLKYLLLKHGCEIIAIGNGVACRETETYIGKLIQSNFFAPLDVVYTIVSEQGVSIYSCSEEAAREFPDMDTNLRSAVSLARRVQDPLGELVKVEPRHLGVGMYQHDMSNTILRSALEEIVTECVSFVGVDLNTASLPLLRRIAGLNPTRAQNVIEWRTEKGLFQNREQLKKVKGIGAKTFEQCAGFVRILPVTSMQCGKTTEKDASKATTSKKKSAKTSNDEPNPLDQTWIHPESYSIAMRMITKCKLDASDLGKPDFIRGVQEVSRKCGIQSLCEEFSIGEAQMKLIIDGLSQPPGHDIRSDFEKPLFRKGVTSMNDLKEGTALTGRVENVTDFGTFVDIGVGQSGLIPKHRIRSNIQLGIGDVVEVKVVTVEIQRRRISLDFLRIVKS